MRLRRRRPEPEPSDRDHEWEDLLHSFRTRSSRPMQREIYHRKARQARQVEAMFNPPVKGFGGVPPSSSTGIGVDVPAQAPSEPSAPPGQEPGHLSLTSPSIQPEPRPLTAREQLEAQWGDLDAGERAWRQEHGDDREPVWGFL